MADFQKVAQVSEIPNNGLKPVQVSGADVCLVNLDGQIYAIGDVCTHAHCSLSDGEVEDGTVVCPCHGGGFDPKTGQVVQLPPGAPVLSYPVRIEGDDILVSELP